MRSTHSRLLICIICFVFYTDRVEVVAPVLANNSDDIEFNHVIYDNEFEIVVEDLVWSTDNTVKFLQKNCNPERYGAWSCEHMVETFLTENGTLHPERKGYNDNGSYDLGVCQLNSRSHKWFFSQDKEYKLDWKIQSEYCISVWNNAFERKLHPAKRWYAYR